MAERFDRRRQDMGNILGLEHVNVKVPDQTIATAFYVQALGFTRDPYLMMGTENMWINIGQQQFHLPTGDPQVLRGCVGLVVPDLQAVVASLASQREKLAGTKFAYTVEDKYVAVTSPWGNRFRIYGAGPEFGDMTLGMPYVEFPVAPGTAAGIARFYEEIMDAPAAVTPDAKGVAAHVKVGTRQELVFRETPAPAEPYDKHHIAIYIGDFSGPHRRLEELGLVTEESNEYQYRFETIVDPKSKAPLFVIEHEVRCYTHPMFLRPLINRNPEQRQPTYQRRRDAFYPGAN
jgi:catechol 2,3-dioxygenase-like lactoylglutathione lyase family enzyme